MKKLRIGIDINEANTLNRVGTGQYCFNILKYICQHKEFDFHLYHRDKLQSDLPSESSNFHYHKVSPKIGWINFGLPIYLLLHEKNDIFWSPAHYSPWYAGGKNIVTIHDVAYEFFPSLFLRKDLYKLRKWTKSSLNRAEKIIAVSLSTKMDISKIYGIEKERITVIYNGYDKSVFNITTKPLEVNLSKYSLTPNLYLLYMGTVQPRKNIVNLIKSFEIIKKNGYKGKLVIGGKMGWLSESVEKAIENSPCKKDIVQTGYINSIEQKLLYSYADVFVLPSLYEGFGVPVIEAMACGAPVAGSNNSSLSEIINQFGELFDPTNPYDMAEKIMKIKENREYWIAKSLVRATHFSWEKCAEETINLLTSNV